MYFESHAHYDDNRYKDDISTLLSELPKQGISYVVNAGADMKSSRIGLDLAKKYDYIYTAVGVHPHYTEKMTDKDLVTLQDYAKKEKVVAIGEIGLDFYYNSSPQQSQRYWFKQQLKLAENTKLPAIIHSREATEETFEIIKNSKVRRGVVHCFSSSWEMAVKYVKLGFYIGITGVVTYPNAKQIIEVVDKVPLDRLLIETDCPYLSPQQKRGKRNDSTNLKYIAEKIAEIKKLPLEEVAQSTLKNGKLLFGIV